MMGGFGGGMGGVGWLGMVAFWGLVIWGIVAAANGFRRREDGRFERGESSLEILKRRYAQGEIDKAEFEDKKRELV